MKKDNWMDDLESSLKRQMEKKNYGLPKVVDPFAVHEEGDFFDNLLMDLEWVKQKNYEPRTEEGKAELDKLKYISLMNTRYKKINKIKNKTNNYGLGK